jgi:hypothetical protein
MATLRERDVDLVSICSADFCTVAAAGNPNAVTTAITHRYLIAGAICPGGLLREIESTLLDEAMFSPSQTQQM